MSDRLKRSILGIVGLYMAAQTAIFLAFAIPAGFVARYFPPFLATSLGFHGLLLALLLLFKRDFVIEATGQKLDRVNKANKITLLRLSTLPTLLFLIFAAKDYKIRTYLLILVILVFLTDFADGYISRKEGQVTRVGRLMDSASDYSLLIVLSIVFYYFDLIPLWFFGLVALRLTLQSVFVIILVLVRKKLEVRTTFLGKATVASLMVLYSAELLGVFIAKGIAPIVTAAEWATAAIIAASIVDKIVEFSRLLFKKPE